MIGCITFPLRLLAVLVIVLALAGGWLYRDRLVEEVRHAIAAPPPAAEGRPTDEGLRTARDRLGALARGADSVVLDADAAASLVGAGLDRVVRERLDSLTVRLGPGRITVSGVVGTGRLPVDLVGPLSILLRERERVALGGPVGVASPGRAAWTIDRLAVRGVPVPRDFVAGLVDRALGAAARGAIAVELPPAVRALRVEPQRIILYRNAGP